MHKPTEKTRKAVSDMTAYGSTQQQIARVLNISVPTLLKHYKEEVETSSTIANTAVAGKLFEKCMAGDTTSIIFWLKTQARWRENHDREDSENQKLLLEAFNGLIQKMPS